MEYKHYVRVENELIVKAFSSAFEEPIDGDILFDDTDIRHFNPEIINEHGQFVYKWDNGFVLREEEELREELESRPKEETEIDILKKQVEELTAIINQISNP